MGGSDSSAVRALRRGILACLSATAFLCFKPASVQAVAGDLDPGFGVAGAALPAITGATSITVRALAVQSDGKIVGVADYIHSAGGDQDLMVFRLLSTGALDTGFGSGGWVTTDFGACEWAEDLLIQPDGKIVAVGTQEPTCGADNNYRGVLARYETNGSPDNTFGTAGQYIMSSSYQTYWHGVARQSDGKLVVAGHKDHVFCVARFTTGGAPDNTFNTSGLVTVPLGASSTARDVTVDGNGKILAVGTQYNTTPTNPDFAAARFNDNGSPDTTFNSTGVWTADLNSNSTDYALSVAINGAGRIYIAGHAWGGGFSTDGTAILARLTSAGLPDATFGSGGLTSYTENNEYLYTRGVTLDPWDQPVLAGYFGSTVFGVHNHDSWLMRFTAGGELDHGFGTDGLMVVSRGNDLNLVGRVVADSAGGLLCPGENDDNPIVTRHQTDDHSDRWGTRWWWSDPERNDTYLLGDGFFTVSAVGGQNLWNCNRMSAPMFFRNLPPGDHWTVQTVIYVPTLYSETMSGLMIWNGNEFDGNVHALYIGLGHSGGQPWVMVEGSIPGNCGYHFRADSYALDTVVVKIVRSGNNYTFSRAQLFNPWIDMGTITTTADFSKVGAMAKTWNVNPIEASYTFFGVFNPLAGGLMELLLGK